MSTVAVLSALSLAVTVAVASAPAASGVPVIDPVLSSIARPEGSPAALYSSMPVPPAGSMAVMASPTFRVAGAV